MKEIMKYRVEALVGGFIGSIIGAVLWSLLDYLLEFNSTSPELGNLLMAVLPAICGAYWGAKVHAEHKPQSK